MIRKSRNWPRLLTQLFFFILILLIALNKSFSESGKVLIPFLSSASLHGLCPMGGVVSIYQFLTVGTFIQKIHQSSFILMFLVLFLSVLFGPVFCGWICPLGSLQEFLSKAGQKIFGKKFNNFVPYRYDKYLRYISYVILIWVLYTIGVSGKLIFEAYDPYYALFNFWTDEVAVSALIILGITLISSLFVERPWCKYACPYGALLGLTNFFRIFKIRRSENNCISCSACDSACPMNITPSDKSIIRNHQCISCLKCTSEFHCPVTDTLEFTTKGGKQL